MSGGEEYLLSDRVTRVTSYVNLALAALGLVGNCVCLRMMLTSPVRHISSSLFFFSISLSDAVVVCFELASDIRVLMTTADDILYSGNPWRCRFGHFGRELCRIASSWYLVAMAAELYLVTRRPAKAKVIYKRRRSCLVSVYVALVACAGTLPVLVITSGDGVTCTSSYSIFLDFYLNVIIRPCIVFIFPAVLLTFCLVKVFKALTSSGGRHSIIEQQSSGSYKDDKDLEQALKGGFQARNGIVAVTVLFLVTSLPAMVVDILGAIETYRPPLSTSLVTQPQLGMAHSIVRSLLLVNYCLKFYVLIAVENDFKQAMSFVSKCGLFRYNRGGELSTQYRLQATTGAAANGSSTTTSNGAKNGVINHNSRTASAVINWQHSQPHTSSTHNGLAHRF